MFPRHQTENRISPRRRHEPQMVSPICRAFGRWSERTWLGNRVTPSVLETSLLAGRWPSLDRACKGVSLIDRGLLSWLKRGVAWTEPRGNYKTPSLTAFLSGRCVCTLM